MGPKPNLPAECPNDSAIGWVQLRGNCCAEELPINTLVYNLKPGPNEPAKFGFRAGFETVILRPTAAVRPGGEYGLKVDVSDVTQTLPVVGQKLTLWGVPGDPSHDTQRGGPFGGRALPFLTNPTSCTGPVATGIRMNSWQEPGNYQEASFLTHEAGEPDKPIGAVGCDKLSFEPSLSLQTDPPGAAQPTALSATLHLPQSGNAVTEQLVAKSLATSHLRKAVVKLPAGVARQPGRGERPRLLQRGAVRLPQRQPGELPGGLQGRHGRSRHAAARRPAQGLDLPRPAERQPVRQPAGRLHGGGRPRGDGQDRRQDRHRPDHGPGHRDLRQKPAAAVQRLQAGLFRRTRRMLVNPNGCGTNTATQHVRPRGLAAP